MWPWSHAAVGYVLYTVLLFAVRRRPLRGREAIVVVLGTQLPDLIDKPLGWTLAVLPSGRSLGHSLVTWLLVAVVVLALARRFDRRWFAPALIVGYLVGILTDLPPGVFDGEFVNATFLLWPLLPSPEFGVERSLLASIGRLEPGDLELFLVVCAGLVGAQLVLSFLYSGDPTVE